MWLLGCAPELRKGGRASSVWQGTMRARPPSIRHILSAAFVLGLAAFSAASFTACGGSAPEAKSAPNRELELTDESSAVSELDRAEGQITALFGPAGGAALQGTAEPLATGTFSTPP